MKLSPVMALHALSLPWTTLTDNHSLDQFCSAPSLSLLALSLLSWDWLPIRQLQTLSKTDLSLSAASSMSSVRASVGKLHWLTCQWWLKLQWAQWKKLLQLPLFDFFSPCYQHQCLFSWNFHSVLTRLCLPSTAAWLGDLSALRGTNNSGFY